MVSALARSLTHRTGKFASADREGSRDLARCTAMILVDPVIDPAASELKELTCIDRLIGLAG